MATFDGIVAIHAELERSERRRRAARAAVAPPSRPKSGAVVAAAYTRRARTPRIESQLGNALNRPDRAENSGLSGVSCTSATACTAVGDSYNSADIDVTLAEAWNGTKWAVEPTPNPTGAENSGLSAVSCISATACTAVGTYVNSTFTNLTLVERYS
ncbi:MAG: hypothetical protein ABSD78_19215 [Acidimicrobiales bacterium]|jgi:hypothetical protein